ncbi:MAG: ROK family protein [Clostridia bacterium]
MKNIGVDIGGTFIKCAIVDKKGNITASCKTPTPKMGSDIPDAVIDLIYSLLKKSNLTVDDIYTIGIGTTGICDSKNGIVITGANIEGYKNIEICRIIKEKTGKDTFIDNDANCAALGEYVAANVKCHSFIFITLGTGIGGGIILNGKILRGVNGGAGEIGHITLVKDGEKCNCGRKGCWERYASVSALSRQTREAGFTGEVNGKTVFEKSLKGDKVAQKVLDKWLNYVSEGICDMVNIFQPDLIVIGGGVSREGDRILKPVADFVNKNSMTGKITALKQTDIRISQLFNDAGVIGASFLYTQN